MLLGSYAVVAATTAFDSAYDSYKSGDFKTAFKEMFPLAEQGNIDAQFYIGSMYSEGKGVTKNDKRAAKWYTLAAEQGDMWAQNTLAGRYETGTGVRKNYKTAFDWYAKSAEQGYDASQYYLGNMYSDGKGVLKNDKTALKWYTKAADQGYVKAQFALGNMYSDGKGVLKNDKTAAKWFTLAAEQGYAAAQFNLGLYYVRGKGVLQDNRRAYMWWSLSAHNDGPDRASKNRDTVAKEMTSADISEAQDMTSRCLESNYKNCQEAVLSIDTQVQPNQMQSNSGESYNCELDASASKGWVPSTIQISFNDDKELTKLYSADYPPYDFELAKVLRYTKDFREIKYIEQSTTSTGARLKTMHTITIMPKLNNKIIYEMKFSAYSNRYNVRGKCEKL